MSRLIVVDSSFLKNKEIFKQLLVHITPNRKDDFGELIDNAYDPDVNVNVLQL